MRTAQGAEPDELDSIAGPIARPTTNGNHAAHGAAEQQEHRMRPSTPPSAMSVRAASSSPGSASHPPVANSPNAEAGPVAQSAEDQEAQDDLRHDFFDRGDAGHHDREDASLSDLLLHRPMASGPRRAMIASITMVVVSILLIGGYLVYHKLLMPTPVELGDTGPMIGFDAPLVGAGPAAVTVEPPSEPSAGLPAGSAADGEVTPVEGEGTPAEGEGVLPAPEGEMPPAEGLAVPSSEGPALEPEQGAAAAADGAEGMEVTPTPVQAEPALAVDDGEPEQEAESAEAESESSDNAPGTEGTPVLTPEMAQAYAKALSDGYALQRAGQTVHAQASYERALSIVPDGSGALSKMALLHLNAGRSAEARSYAERAAEADSGNAEAWIVLGSILQAAGDPRSAQEAYGRCASLEDPQYSVECQRLLR